MVTATTILLGILTVQYALCMPSDDGRIKKLLELEDDVPKLADEPYSIFENDEILENKKAQGQREKRWYDAIPYNYPPPFTRPYNRESDLESTLSSIRSNLDQILHLAKSPPPPPPSIYPMYIPIYIPQPICGCNTDYNEQRTTKAPEQLTTTTTTEQTNKETVPDFSDRFPDIDDERRNWGLVINNTVADYDDADDGSRPISLDPSLSNEDGAPPVDHGSSQADVNNPGTSTVIEPPRAVVVSSENSQRTCDKAALSCCLGPNKTYECIQSRGCRDETLRQDPCNPQNLRPTINRLQSYYS